MGDGEVLSDLLTVLDGLDPHGSDDLNDLWLALHREKPIVLEGTAEDLRSVNELLAKLSPETRSYLLDCARRRQLTRGTFGEFTGSMS